MKVAKAMSARLVVATRMLLSSSSPLRNAGMKLKR